MPYIIGQSSVISFVGKGTEVADGIVSVQWQEGRSFSPLYQLGGIPVYAVQFNSAPSLNITVYGDAGTPVFTETDLDVPVDCADSSLQISVTFVPGFCPATPGWNINNEVFFVNSYSYSKDVSGIGQETWSLIGKPVSGFSMANQSSYGANLNIPSQTDEDISPKMINGIPTGNRSGDVSSPFSLDDTGVKLYATSPLESRSMEASAGAISLGKATTTEYGFAKQLGGSTVFKADGIILNASVNIEYNPIYVS